MAEFDQQVKWKRGRDAHAGDTRFGTVIRWHADTQAAKQAA